MVVGFNKCKCVPALYSSSKLKDILRYPTYMYFYLRLSLKSVSRVGKKARVHRAAGQITADSAVTARDWIQNLISLNNEQNVVTTQHLCCTLSSGGSIVKQ